MSKSNPTTEYADGDTLYANSLNQDKKDGMLNNKIPYAESDFSQDSARQFSIGAKGNEYKNSYVGRINAYTTAERNALTLTAEDDGMQIWNLTERIFQYYDQLNDTWVNFTFGGSSMDYLFGDGRDGDITIVADTVLDAGTVKFYNTLTINEGVSLSVNTSPLSIYVKEKLTVNGTIHVNESSRNTKQAAVRRPGYDAISAYGIFDGAPENVLYLSNHSEETNNIRYKNAVTDFAIWNNFGMNLGFYKACLEGMRSVYSTSTYRIGIAGPYTTGGAGGGCIAIYYTTFTNNGSNNIYARGSSTNNSGNQGGGYLLISAKDIEMGSNGAITSIAEDPNTSYNAYLNTVPVNHISGLCLGFKIG